MNWEGDVLLAYVTSCLFDLSETDKFVNNNDFPLHYTKSKLQNLTYFSKICYIYNFRIVNQVSLVLLQPRRFAHLSVC
jgi:hypothetical protein